MEAVVDPGWAHPSAPKSGRVCLPAGWAAWALAAARAHGTATVAQATATPPLSAGLAGPCVLPRSVWSCRTLMPAFVLSATLETLPSRLLMPHYLPLKERTTLLLL